MESTDVGTLTLPTRRHRRAQAMTIQRNRSSLEILLQMGFPKNRAERSLAATGDKGVQLASDWLLSHVNDATIDVKVARDYIFYLCPVGQLQQEFFDFWQKSYQECGWNRAHNYFPHITLCSFFQADDSLVSHMSHAIKTVAERVTNAPETVEFDFFSSANFVGLFIKESFAVLLNQITTDFAEEMHKAGVTMGPLKKQLHLSLAYQFQNEKKEKLEALARTINLKSPVSWDLRLYSRDAGKTNCQVRQVLYTHAPVAADELEMCDGDIIYMNEAELSTSTDGWYLGTSWLTGCTGMFPGVFTERTAETETWTLHRSIPLIGSDLAPKAAPGTEDHLAYNGNINFQTLRKARATKGARSNHDNMSALYVNQLTAQHDVPSLTDGVSNCNGFSLHEIVTEDGVLLKEASIATSSSLLKTDVNVSVNGYHGVADVETAVTGCQGTHAAASADKAPSLVRGAGGRMVAIDGLLPVTPVAAASGTGPRQLFVVRHGERVDNTFGKDWVDSSFNSSGQYVRYDLNMPKWVPSRRGGPRDFSLDGPLTVQGNFQARVLGEAMREKDIVISHVYASPALRCVQTACSLLEGLGLSQEINVECGLFEWLGWYQLDMLPFIPVPELRDAGYNLNLSYTQIWPFTKYNVKESIEEFYERSHTVTKEILKRHETEGGNVLIVAHGINVDSCTRQLVGQQPRGRAGFFEIIQKVPYCAMSVVQEATVVRDTWYLVEPPVLPYAHTKNAKYNWTILSTPALT